MRAGIDRREQKKTAAVLEKDVMRRARAAAGIEESHETRQVERARAKLADAYDGYDMKVRFRTPLTGSFMHAGQSVGQAHRCPQWWSEEMCPAEFWGNMAVCEPCSHGYRATDIWSRNEKGVHKV